jgi:hypothetical protein
VFNVFGIEAGLNILELKLSEKHWPLVYPFLTFLKVIENIDEETDPVIEESLRKI